MPVISAPSKPPPTLSVECLQPLLRRSERRPIHWPHGARMAFWVAPNIEYYEVDPPRNPVRPSWPRPAPDILNWSLRDYGNRVGVWRCLDVFRKHGVVGSVSLNAAMCRHLPEVVREFSGDGWELFYHGLYNTRYLFGRDPEEERGDIAEACGIIQDFCGRPVRGFLAPALTYTDATFRVAAECGIEYVFDLFREDVPQALNPSLGRMIGIPYNVELNDFHALVQGGLSPGQYLDRFKAHFDRLYAESEHGGKVVGLPLHPYVIGMPHFIGVLDEMLAHVRRHTDVWVCRAQDIADWHFAHHYEHDLRLMAQHGSARP